MQFTGQKILRDLFFVSGLCAVSVRSQIVKFCLAVAQIPGWVYTARLDSDSAETHINGDTDFDTTMATQDQSFKSLFADKDLSEPISLLISY